MRVLELFIFDHPSVLTVDEDHKTSTLGQIGLI